MNEPLWIDLDEALAAHDLQLAEHGGSSGVRDQGLLESALARPRNVFAYSPETTLFHLAAAYAVGIVKNHPYVDGNKRTGLVVAVGFLELNEIEIVASQPETYLTFLALAASELSEEDLVKWFEAHAAPL
jgi:death-on-curing protein